MTLDAADLKWQQLITGPLWERWLDPQTVAAVVVRCQRALALQPEAMHLVAGGRAFYACPDGSKTYEVDTALGCSCMDAKYSAPDGWCKHRIALWLQVG